MATQKTAVEHYVGAMIKTHGLLTMPKLFVEKALALVNRKIEDPCCVDDEEVVDLITRRRNVFSDTVEILLNTIPKAGNVQSLERTKKLLERRLNCCEE